ncbi:MAG: Yip1 family protein [Pseudomonadota bacterium]
MTKGSAITLGKPASSVLHTIWRQPRATLRRITHDNPGYGVFVLPVLASFATYPVASLALGDNAAEDTAGYVTQSLLSFPPALELLQLFAAAFLLSRLAPVFHGRGDSRRLLSALAWSNAPIVLLAPISLAAVMFAESLGVPRAAGGLPLTVLVPALVLQVGAILWSKVLLVIGCAEALVLPPMRAAACVLVAWLLSAAALALVVSITLGGEAVLSVFSAGLTEAFLGHR